MIWLIYKHTNLRTNKAYIGYTSKTLEQRWNEHVKNANRGKDGHFHRAIRKFGTKCWTHEVLQASISTLKKAARAEVQWVAHFKTFDDGYNMTKGGEGRTAHHFKHTLSAIAKIKRALKGRPVSQITRRKISKANTGNKFSVAHKRKLSIANSGRKLSLKTRKKMS